MSRLKFVLMVTLTVGGLARQPVCAEQKNLLIIETDEHHFKMPGCYGGTIVGTPNIDWIANNGAKCTSSYATTPVCSASRAALVSGLYSSDHQQRVVRCLQSVVNTVDRCQLCKGGIDSTLSVAATTGKCPTCAGTICDVRF